MVSTLTNPVAEGFVALDQLTDDESFPPRPPFVGRAISYSIETREFDSRKTPGTKDVQRTLLYVVEPLNAAAETEDGNYRTYGWKISTRKNSVYGIALASSSKALSEAVGSPVSISSPEDLLNVTLLWGEVDKAQLTKQIFGGRATEDQKMKYHALMPLGAAPAGWEATIPPNLAALKAAGMQKGRERAANKKAGQAAAPSGTSVQAQAITSPATTDLKGQDDAIIEFLEGKTPNNFYVALRESGDFRTTLQELGIEGLLLNNQAQVALINANKLTIDGGIYRRV